MCLLRVCYAVVQLVFGYFKFQFAAHSGGFDSSCFADGNFWVDEVGLRDPKFFEWIAETAVAMSPQFTSQTLGRATTGAVLV